MGTVPEDADMKKAAIALMAFCVAAAAAPQARADDRAVWGAVAGAIIGYQLSRDHGHPGHRGHPGYPPVVVGGYGGYYPGATYPQPLPQPHPRWQHPGYGLHPGYVPPLVCHKIPVYNTWGQLTHYQQICRR
jgi:hypothetical protein